MPSSNYKDKLQATLRQTAQACKEGAKWERVAIQRSEALRNIGTYTMMQGFHTRQRIVQTRTEVEFPTASFPSSVDKIPDSATAETIMLTCLKIVEAMSTSLERCLEELNDVSQYSDRVSAELNGLIRHIHTAPDEPIIKGIPNSEPDSDDEIKSKTTVSGKIPKK